jgi:polysaccharide export outer membrane protein
LIDQRHGVFVPFSIISVLVIAASLCVIPPGFSQQKSQEPFKFETTANTNSRIMELAAAKTARQGDYIIGSGDLLGIEVFDVPELTREVRVNETGFISMPLLPTKINASGLTQYQLQDKIAELLQTNGLVSTPEVTVSVKEQRSQPITVIGAVKSPMVIQAMRQTTLLQVLSQAGGISDDAGSIVMVTRSSETQPAQPTADPQPRTFTIELNDLLDSGDGRFNIPVVGGDVVSVPRAGIVYIVGAVNHPGGFVMQNDRDRMTALKVLSLAGGTLGTAKSNESIILRKDPLTGQREKVPVDLNKVLHLKSEDVTLQASDILYVPDSTAKRAAKRAGDIAISLATGVAIVRAANGL